MLEFPTNTIYLHSFTQSGSGLVKAKRDIGCYTLSAYIQYPIIIANPRIHTRLSSDRYIHYNVIEIARQIQRSYQRSTKQKLMPQSQQPKKRQPIIRPVLIFYGTSNSDMVITIAPITGQRYSETVYTFRRN